MTDRVYLDWNATTPLRPEARQAMTRAMEICGNPSSVHAEGRAARALIEQARSAVASAVGALAQNVVFTSGGTEANALALQPGLRGTDGSPLDRLIVSAIEHASVLEGGRFAREEVVRARVRSDGLVDLPHLESLLAGTGPALVSVMLANNETGALQPVRAVADIVHGQGGLLHVDAVPAVGKIHISMNELGADLLTVSGHKVGGPKGVGALVLSDRVVGLNALIHGGGQEKGRRGGTENVIGIAGFGGAIAATMAAMDGDVARMAALKARLEAGLKTTDRLVIFAESAPRLANTTLFTVSGLRAETAVIGFDLEGVAVSSGSACSSGKVAPSHVLAAMGVAPDMARGGIRVSLGWSTTDSDIETFLKSWRKLTSTLLKRDDETVLERF